MATGDVCGDESASCKNVMKCGVNFDLEGMQRTKTKPEDHLDFLAQSSFCKLEIMVQALKDYGLNTSGITSNTCSMEELLVACKDFRSCIF